MDKSYLYQDKQRQPDSQAIQPNNPGCQDCIDLNHLDQVSGLVCRSHYPSNPVQIYTDSIFIPHLSSGYTIYKLLIDHTYSILILKLLISMSLVALINSAIDRAQPGWRLYSLRTSRTPDGAAGPLQDKPPSLKSNPESSIYQPSWLSE